jgi:hypothetical protein
MYALSEPPGALPTLLSLDQLCIASVLCSARTALTTLTWPPTLELHSSHAQAPLRTAVHNRSCARRNLPPSPCMHARMHSFAYLQPRRVKIDLKRHGVKYLAPDAIRVVPSDDDKGTLSTSSVSSLTTGPSPANAQPGKDAMSSTNVRSSASPQVYSAADFSALIFLFAVTVLSAVPLIGLAPGFRAKNSSISVSPGSTACSGDNLPLVVDPWQGGHHKPSTIWPGARGDYARDGYTVLPGVLDNTTISHLGAFLDHLLAK